MAFDSKPSPRQAASDPPARKVFALATGHYDNRAAGETGVARPLGTDDHFLTYTHNGRGRVVYAGGELITEPGSVLVILPRTPHEYDVLVEPEQRWERTWAHFHPPQSWLDLMGLPESAKGILYLPIADGEVRARIERRLLDMHRVAKLEIAQAERLAMNALEETLLLCDVENPNGGKQRLDPRVRRAVEHIATDLKRPLAIGYLAKHCGISRSRLSELFRLQVGVTPQQFQEHQRLDKARRLLVITNRSVAEVAYEVGFASPFYFSLRFKRAMGASPRAYREQLVSRDRAG